jgi:replicative DNA helicase
MKIQHSLSAEKAVLSACLISSGAIARVIQYLAPEHFFDPRHRVIYASLCEMFAQAMPIDLVTLSNYLAEKGLIAKAGGHSYIAEVSAFACSPAHVQEHAWVIIDKYIKRHLRSVSLAIAEHARKDVYNSRELLNEIERQIFQLNKFFIRKSVYKYSQIANETLQKIETIRKMGVSLTGISSGYPSLDAITHGFRPQEMIVIASRPSVGKTAFALNLAYQIAFIQKIPTLFFSLEMSREQIVTRLFSIATGIGGSDLMTGSLSDVDMEALYQAQKRYQSVPLFIDDTPAMSIYEFHSKCRQMRSEHDIQIVIVDYLQLMRGSRLRNATRQEEVSAISQAIKQIAKEVEVPVIALAQLNRLVELRANKKPQLSDLRESGSIEQDADIVAFLYKPEDSLPDQEARQLSIVKHRNGPIGDVEFVFEKRTQRFTESIKLDI